MTDVTPVSDVAQAVDAAVKTIENPLNPAILVEDVLLAHKIATDVQAALAGKHPSFWQLVATLLHLNSGA